MNQILNETFLILIENLYTLCYDNHCLKIHLMSFYLCVHLFSFKYLSELKVPNAVAQSVIIKLWTNENVKAFNVWHKLNVHFRNNAYRNLKYAKKSRLNIALRMWIQDAPL